MRFEYINKWHFWAAVIIVAFVANWVWMRFFRGKGQIV